jgi:hypothetical protein
MRDQEMLGLMEAYTKIYEQVQNESVEEVDNYDEILEYLLSEGYSKEESDQIMVELINEAGLGALVKGAKAIAGFVAKRAKTPLKTAATDSLITSTALNPVSTAKIAQNVAKSSSPTPIVRTVKPSPARTAPKGANKITTNVWNEPTAPRSRINPSKPSGNKVTSTKALSGTPSRPALPSAGKTSASVKAPKPTFKPEALPKVKSPAEPAGALVRTRASKPTFKPEALPKVTKSAEPAGALVRTRASKPTFKPEALPKVTKSAEPAGALVRAKAPKPTFKPEAFPKVKSPAEPAGALVRAKAPKPTFKPEALPKTKATAEPAGALVRAKAPKPTFKPEALPKTKATAEPAGALVRTKTPKPTTKPTTNRSTSGGGKPSKGGGLTQTVRATLSPAEKTGNMKYPGLEKYATGSSSSGGPSKSPSSSLSRNLKTAGIVGTAAAGAAGLDQIGKENKRKQDQKIRQSIKTDVYNTMDSDSTIRSRKKVGPKIVGTGSVAGDFDVAFKKARTSGQKEFEFRGKKYNTKMKENFEYQNTLSVYEEVLSYLLDEGFASDEKSAEAIMGSMSKSWIESIVEQTARIDYVQDKFNRENARKSGSALTHISGKQNTGQALQKAKESARQMGKLEGA